MSADLSIAVLAVPCDRDLDPDAAKRVLAALGPERVASRIDACIGRDEDPVDAAIRAIDDIVGAFESPDRHCWMLTDFASTGLDVLIVGGSSWGDPPPHVVEAAILEALPEVFEALGLTPVRP